MCRLPWGYSELPITPDGRYCLLDVVRQRREAFFFEPWLKKWLPDQ
jgi:hypothetical protein